MVAGRYELIAPIGKGATADVYRARHDITGEHVAVKLFRTARDVEPARLRREIALLRSLRLPGVVELIAEGVHEGRPFLVTSFVDGKPFPGVSAPASWSDIARPTMAVLEILSRVHAAGVIHRDIKPANVLVEKHGGVKVLDFGIAWAPALAEGLTEDERYLGTPAYLAPEQLRGLPPDARSDLYSLGVTLFEALTGQLPHSVAHPASFFAARTGGAARSIRSVAAGVPIRWATAIDRLLSLDAADRPQTAAEVIQILWDRAEAPESARLPWLGPRTIIDRVAGAARSGQSLSLIGEPGHGKSRILSEARAVLTAEGREVVELLPATYPFESLEPLVGLALRQDTGLGQMEEAATFEIQTALRRGAVLIADDFERLDPSSRRALCRCRKDGAILSAERSVACELQPDTLMVTPLQEEALRSLFIGRERVFHVPGDAAHMLFARTEGVPRSVETQLAAWTRQNMVRPHGDRWSIPHAALERMREASFSDMLLPGAPWSAERPPPAWHDLLAFVGFLAPEATAESLSRALGWPRFRTEAGIAELLEKGYLRSVAGDRVEPRWVRFSIPEWPPEKFSEAHRRAAETLPSGAKRRLFHVVAASIEEGVSREDAILEEACARSNTLIGEGHLGTAIFLLHDAVGTALKLADPRRLVGGAAFVPAFSLWAELALAQQAVTEADRLLCELLRIRRPHATLRAIEALLTAMIRFRNGAADSLELAERVPPFDDIRLERQRWAVRVLAARRADLSVEERIVDETSTWADRVSHPEARAAGLACRGRLRYKQGRYAEAGELQEAASKLERLPTLMIAGQLNAASAWLEAFRHADAERLAAAALPVTAACRSFFFEARAEWILRTARFRQKHPLLPDEGLIEATAELNVPDQLTVTCLTEAAIAWHTGQMDTAARIAATARHTWKRMGLSRDAEFAECLEIGSGAPVTRERALTLARSIGESTAPNVAIQALALLSVRLPADPWLVARVRELWTSTDPIVRGLRADVLSADEALALVEGRFQRTSSERRD